jgi:hypothetical protein
LGQTLTSRARRVLLVGLVALGGLAVAVALALVTSHLTAQHVGLAGEPTRPASGLVAPVRRTRPAPRQKRRPARTRPKTVTAAPPTVTVTSPPVTVVPAPTPAPSTAPIHHDDHQHGDD